MVTVGVWLIAALLLATLILVVIGWSDVMNALANHSRRLSAVEKAQRAKQSRILLREESNSSSKAMPIARREHTEAVKEPDKPHIPMADPEHPDRPFFG